MASERVTQLQDAPTYKEITPLQTLYNPIDWRELWQSRELVWFLTMRGFKSRYKQTILGPAWSIIQPLIMTVVFSFVFGTLAQLPTDGGVPTPIFMYASLLGWNYFAGAISGVTRSLTSNASMINKVYFPRLVLPIVSVMSALIDFLISLLVLLVLMAVYGIMPTWNIIFLPVGLLLATITALGVGLCLASLNVRFRDIGYGLPFMIQVWMFITPVVYSSSVFPPPLDTLYILNPMAGVIEGFRWALLGLDTLPDLSALISVIISLVLLGVGLLYFRRVESVFADIV